MANMLHEPKDMTEEWQEKKVVIDSCIARKRGLSYINIVFVYDLFKFLSKKVKNNDCWTVVENLQLSAVQIT